ncbi:dephospho-CoA kinase [Picrophilus oshimae]|nr:dephospho-CoA kinase [Picrophilus oshimae]SMD30297.1 Dephospho-CoA kinase [Picrophilus oshimae DSM 9789]
MVWDIFLVNMIIITGMPGAGKDEFVKVAKSMGFLDVHMGNTVKKYAYENNIKIDDTNIGKFASDERKKYGMDIWAKRTSKYILDEDITIVDGLRNYEELEYFKNNYDDIIVIAIFANEEQRFERIIKRNREDDIKSYNEMKSRDDRELTWGIGKVISLADYMIVNNKSLEEYKSDVKSLLKTIIDSRPKIREKLGL